MSLITLMTDFGMKDGNVGVMRGVIWGIAPEAQIADLSHLIGPQNVPEAAWILGRSAPYFPEGTVHIVVVDPGVGTARRPIAARLGPQRFVGPDNGVVTGLLDRAEREGWPVEIVHLDQPAYWLEEVSNVFHGRDIFSPAGAHLWKGVPLSDLGSPVDDPIRLTIPRPEIAPDGLRSEVMHIDHFGNIATSIRREDLPGVESLTVRLGGVEVQGLVQTFGDRQVGELVALYGSTGSLIVAEVNGSAANRLQVRVGEPVEVVTHS